MGVGIWYDDIKGFMDGDQYYKIIPLQTMSIEEKLNAIVRFFLYGGVIIALVLRDSRFLFMGIVAGFVSIIVYEFEKDKKTKSEKFLEEKELDVVDNKVCARSTVENPFMNILVSDYADAPNRPEACNVLNDSVQEKINDNFKKRLFRDVSDIWNKESSQRQFYTMPSTTIPNDQTGFAEWLYGRGASCKEGNGIQCYLNRP